MQRMSPRLRAPGCPAAGGVRGGKVLRPDCGRAWKGLRLPVALSVVGLLVGLGSPAAASEVAEESQFNDALSEKSAQTRSIEDELDVTVLAEGVSSRRLKRSTADDVPLQQLTPEGRRLAQGVLDEASLHRRLPVVRCEADPRVMHFFLTHPDVAVAIWRAMDVSDMQLKQVSPHRYQSDSGDGSTGMMTVLLANSGNYVIHCSGEFKSPVLARPLQASALMCLKTEFKRDAQGRELADCTADVYVAFPSHTVEAAARIISPVSNRIADRNFHEVTMFIRMMHLAMTRQPGWVEEVAGRLPGLTPDRTRSLVDTTATVYVDAQKRLADAEQKSLTPEGLRLPIRRESEARTPDASTPATGPVVLGAPESPSVQR